MSQGSDLPYDLQLPRPQRQAGGIYYTPEPIVRYIVGETLTAELWRESAPRVLDPACGDGAFLCEVAQRLIAEHVGSPAECLRVLQGSLFGIDIDAKAVMAARLRVARQVLGKGSSDAELRAFSKSLSKNLVVADALRSSLPRGWPAEFDAIVGNPPYVNIRRLMKQDAALVAEYRRRFRCAHGGFDLYVLFIERAIELLRRGGRCGLIVPNKLATLDYAAPCRNMLISETRLETIADLSDLALFRGASVYPHVIVFEKGAPKRHSVQIAQPHLQLSGGRLQWAQTTTIEQSQLNRRGVFAWHDSVAVESRVPTRSLGELCTLHSGTTGFSAEAIAREVKERNGSADDYPFITSGNIDRYCIRLGDVRFMKRTFADPVLPRETPLVTAAKHCLFQGPKIVLAGMSRRLEAAWHAGPLALGVQVFAAAEPQVDHFYLLALLNSAFLSHVFRTRFSAKRLGGGYLAINKGQLAQLPIPLLGTGNRLHDQLSRLGKSLALNGPDESSESQVDQLTAQLYGLSPAETAQIEATGEVRPSRQAA